MIKPLGCKRLIRVKETENKTVKRELEDQDSRRQKMIVIAFKFLNRKSSNRERVLPAICAREESISIEFTLSLSNFNSKMMRYLPI